MEFEEGRRHARHVQPRRRFEGTKLSLLLIAFQSRLIMRLQTSKMVLHSTANRRANLPVDSSLRSTLFLRQNASAVADHTE